MLYEAYREGKPSPLGRLEVQYGDFALWQRKWLEGGALEKGLAYWKQQLEGIPERLELAKKFGADLVFNPLKDDVVKIVKDMTDGYGCDIYIEATGHPDAVVQGLQMIRKLGRFVEFSVFSHDVSVDWSIISDRKQLDILGVHLGPYQYPFVIEGIADGRIPTEGVVTHQLPLEQYKEGLEMMKKGDKSLKILLVP